MDGDVKKTKLIHIPKFLLPETLTTTEAIPLDCCRLNVSSVSINELGKQLLQASICGDVEEIKLLMSKGAPFTADWLGTSPLHFAAQKNHLEVCEILLRAGISKDARTKVDRTPLHIAVFEGNVEIVKCLLNSKADVNCKDLLNMTPLHWAAQKCHAEITEMLIRHGAQTDVLNKFDLTPLDIALQCDRHDIAEIINMTVYDPEVAAQNLTIEMREMDNADSDAVSFQTNSLDLDSETIPLETVLLEGDCENSTEHDELPDVPDSAVLDDYTEEYTNEIPEKQTETTENTFSESIKLLQQHGITMLPADDDSNILSSILETGHSVVLTEVGKEVLNSTKPLTTAGTVNTGSRLAPKIRTIPIKPKKVITVTPQEFLAMTLNHGGVIKQVNRKLLTNNKSNTKRIVMQKSKVGPILTNVNKFKLQDENLSDTELLMRQLIDARKLVEEYKQKFLKKEAEAEKYKQQLLLIAQSKSEYC
ncbi:hypothetical protein PPYR_04593 [Photinus pyralis]|uniref:Uncharacterized protein n=1 Tax=Photinus pyralis TaxID=7054 RepID=A0A1Y1K3Y4_PHOPY|nr:GA-binding protein subunit beta-1-like [Photinus pyralis]KAB0802407.1 hypothetical protein PPYR_04593 [Photinus pyralis]